MRGRPRPYKGESPEIESGPPSFPLKNDSAIRLESLMGLKRPNLRMRQKSLMYM